MPPRQQLEQYSLHRVCIQERSPTSPVRTTSDVRDAVLLLKLEGALQDRLAEKKRSNKDTVEDLNNVLVVPTQTGRALKLGFGSLNGQIAADQRYALRCTPHSELLQIACSTRERDTQIHIWFKNHDDFLKVVDVIVSLGFQVAQRQPTQQQHSKTLPVRHGQTPASSNRFSSPQVRDARDLSLRSQRHSRPASVGPSPPLSSERQTSQGYASSQYIQRPRASQAQPVPLGSAVSTPGSRQRRAEFPSQLRARHGSVASAREGPSPESSLHFRSFDNEGQRVTEVDPSQSYRRSTAPLEEPPPRRILPFGPRSSSTADSAPRATTPTHRTITPQQRARQESSAADGWSDRATPGSTTSRSNTFTVRERQGRIMLNVKKPNQDDTEHLPNAKRQKLDSPARPVAPTPSPVSSMPTVRRSLPPRPVREIDEAGVLCPEPKEDMYEPIDGLDCAGADDRESQINGATIGNCSQVGRPGVALPDSFPSPLDHAAKSPVPDVLPASQLTRPAVIASETARKATNSRLDDEELFAAKYKLMWDAQTLKKNGYDWLCKEPELKRQELHEKQFAELFDGTLGLVQAAIDKYGPAVRNIPFEKLMTTMRGRC
ncbi:hypothetical protein CPLU01_01287 [Colletotrichum plurivorum]|uniref:Uncharacterized protein n=1 Tax=Colletotrichum plurivorum TaxID=2175906 RepID=A0A8H6NPQ9_9PEZI|nr:hypothetical protein CPLU01_01287 [Colletotrichum plurivorum]